MNKTSLLLNAFSKSLYTFLGGKGRIFSPAACSLAALLFDHLLVVVVLPEGHRISPVNLAGGSYSQKLRACSYNFKKNLSHPTPFLFKLDRTDCN